MSPTNFRSTGYTTSNLASPGLEYSAHSRGDYLQPFLRKVCLWSGLFFPIHPDVYLLVVKRYEPVDSGTLEIRVSIPPHDILCWRLVRLRRLNVVIVGNSLVSESLNRVTPRQVCGGALPCKGTESSAPKAREDQVYSLSWGCTSG